MLTFFIVLTLIILIDWVILEARLTSFLFSIIGFFLIITIFYFIGKSLYMYLTQLWGA